MPQNAGHSLQVSKSVTNPQTNKVKSRAAFAAKKEEEEVFIFQFFSKCHFPNFYLQRLSATKSRSSCTGCQKSVTNKQTHKQTHERTHEQSEI